MSKKDVIAAAADRLFYREGFAATGIDRLAEVAGVALGTVYRHYAGRREIVLAALEHREAAYLRYLEEATAAAEGPARVLGLFDALAGWAEAEGGNGCLFLRAAGAHPDDAALRRSVAEHKRCCLALVNRRLREAGWSAQQAERLAPPLFLLLEGAVAACLPLGDKAAFAEARQAATALLNAAPPAG